MMPNEGIWIGAPAEALAREFKTPLYVYSRERIESAYRAYASAFAAVPHRICYALKANSSVELLKIFAGLGAGADIVSGGELKQALRAGFMPADIVFSGVGKTDEELSLGLEASIGEHSSAAPACSITRSISTGPAPAPPKRSSTSRPVMPISASSRHSAGS